MWRTVKLGDVCEVLDKLRKPITKKNRVSGEYPYYGATGIVDWVADYIFDERLVLVGEDGAKWGAGDRTAFIAEGKYWVNNHAHVLRPIEGMVTHEWLAYYLTSIDLLPWVTGLTVEKLNQARLRSIPIPLPPLPEQHRIVAKLDAVFSEIDKAMSAAERKREQADKLKQSILASELSAEADTPWKTLKLGDVLKTGSGGTPLKSRKEYYENGTISWLLSGAVCKKDIESSETFITELGLDNSSAKVFPKDTVLVAMYGATAGQVGILRFPSATNQAVCGIYPNKDCLPEFLYYHLTNYKETLLERTSGSAQPNLSQIKIKNVPIPLPPLPEQHRIVAKLDAAFADTAKLTATASKQIENYRALKSAVLARELRSEAA